MKQLIQLSLLLALVIGFLPSAKAALLLEPLVGYNLSGKADFEDGDNYSGSGPAYGGRLGYQNFGLQLGLDYLHSSLDLDDDAVDEDLELNEIGAFVGFRFPILLKVYAGYIMSATGKTEFNGQDLELKKGSGYKLGAGWTLLPFVDLNLEYRAGSFEEYEYLGADVEKKVDYSGILVSVSLPFTI